MLEIRLGTETMVDDLAVSKKITVDGISYQIIETVGFVQDIGMRCWIVRMPDMCEKKVVGTMKSARFWSHADRIAPLLSALSGPKAP